MATHIMEFGRKITLKIFLLLVLLQSVEGLMCYFCADSSSQNGRNQCQTWHRTMKYYRKRFEQSGSFTADKYVKNCSAYGDTDRPKSCMIAYIEVGGGMRTFIRDCSDGSIFFSEEIDNNFEKNAIRSDNQTHCSGNNGVNVACVTLCGPDQFGSGDFCNGPQHVSSATFTTSSSFSLFVLLIILERWN